MVWLYWTTFIIHIKTENFYVDIADDVEKRYDTSNFEVDRPLPKGVNKKFTKKTKYNRICCTWPKTYSYLIDGDNNIKKLKEQEM